MIDKKQPKEEQMACVETQHFASQNNKPEEQEHLRLGQPNVAELEAKLTAAEAKANENWNLALLARADLENFRRRAEKDIANAHKYGLEKIIKELLPVIDSLEVTFNSFNNNAVAEGIRDGIKLTLDMFLKTLNKIAVEQVDPLGKEFNPELHQAMSTQENPNLKDNIVVQVMQKGYTLSGRLLRPALVIVVKNGAAT